MGLLYTKRTTGFQLRSAMSSDPLRRRPPPRLLSWYMCAPIRTGGVRKEGSQSGAGMGRRQILIDSRSGTTTHADPPDFRSNQSINAHNQHRAKAKGQRELARAGCSSAKASCQRIGTDQEQQRPMTEEGRFTPSSALVVGVLFWSHPPNAPCGQAGAAGVLSIHPFTPPRPRAARRRRDRRGRGA